MLINKENAGFNHTGNCSGFSAYIKEAYILGLDTYLLILKEIQKVIDKHFEQYDSIQKSCVEKISMTISHLFPGVSKRSFNINIVRFVDIQSNYLNSVRRVYDKFALEMIDLTRKTAEDAFAEVGRYTCNLKLIIDR